MIRALNRSGDEKIDGSIALTAGRSNRNDVTMIGVKCTVISRGEVEGGERTGLT